MNVQPSTLRLDLSGCERASESEREREIMEHLGFCGIIKLTKQIILRNLKHFLCIAFFLALPNALSFIVVGPSIQTLVASLSLLHKASASQGQFPPPDLTPYEEALISKQQHLSVPVTVLSIFSIITSLLCVLLVTFSVCRACINKSPDLKGSLRGVRRSVINFVLTALLVVAVVFTVIVVAMLVMMIIAGGLSLVNVNVVIPVTIMTMGVIGGVLYMLAVAFSLATTVAILEEKKGWEAIRRSMYLIKGSKGVAIGLFSFYVLLGMVPLSVSVSEDAFVVWRWGVGGISVGLQAMVALCSMVSHVVLYMSCKCVHMEPLDTLIAASAQFGPPQLDAAKYLDLETAAFATATPQ